MADEENNSLVPARSATDIERSIDGFHQPLAGYLASLGLPTEDVLHSLAERRVIVNALEEALSVLPMEDRAKAFYLTKFTVAVAVGLFDGALNYLWNETINALRRMVVQFDLEYFYAIVGGVNPKNKDLEGAEDLEQISDHDLLETCRRIGLLSDVNFQRLEHINYMRNHASAAHPNEQQIGGFEMLGWLSVCLKHVITAEPDHSVISIKRLMENIRSVQIPVEDLAVIQADIVRQPQQRIDDLLWTMFGMFCDPRQNTQTKSNIGNLALGVWQASSEDQKYEIGTKFGVYRKNGDVARKDAAQEFLEVVGGQNYKDEDSLAGELLEKLETLRRVHFSMNNFYNEYPHAKDLKISLPANGVVPRAARPSWVKVICACYVGNGYGHRKGVDESAEIYYREYIERFSEAEVIEFLHLMGDIEFTSVLDRHMPDRRIRELSRILKGASENVHLQRALDMIIDGPERKLANLINVSKFKQALSFIPKHK